MAIFARLHRVERIWNTRAPANTLVRLVQQGDTARTAEILRRLETRKAPAVQVWLSVPRSTSPGRV